MSAQDALRDMLAGGPATNGSTPGPDALCETLTAALGLDAEHLKVTGATVYGRGEDARVDVHLSGDARPLRFDRFGDLTKPNALMTALATQVAVARTFKVNDAIGICVAVNKLAEHHAEADDDEAAREWGAEYLRLATTEVVDIGAQADRWRAFAALENVHPARDAGEDRSSTALAAASLVLVDRDTGQRYVRSGWFQAYVKREVGSLYSPATLATLMLRVGWQRPNSQGKVKATSPSDGRRLTWPFYIVAADWESGRVTAGYSSTRAPAGARGLVDTPAVTRNPAEPRDNGAAS